jgi:hypothetical protein
LVSRIEGVDVGPIEELIELLAAGGRGVTISPVREGQPMGGWGSSETYAFDGWEVGWMTAGGGGEIAVGRTIAEAVAAALEVEREEESST